MGGGRRFIFILFIFRCYFCVHPCRSVSTKMQHGVVLFLQKIIQHVGERWGRKHVVPDYFQASYYLQCGSNDPF